MATYPLVMKEAKKRADEYSGLKVPMKRITLRPLLGSPHIFEISFSYPGTDTIFTLETGIVINNMFDLDEYYLWKEGVIYTDK